MGGAGAVGAAGAGGGYLYCLLVDCGNGPLGDFAPTDEGPEEGGAPSCGAGADAGAEAEAGSGRPPNDCQVVRVEPGAPPECHYECKSDGKKFFTYGEVHSEKMCKEFDIPENAGKNNW